MRMCSCSSNIRTTPETLPFPPSAGFTGMPPSHRKRYRNGPRNRVCFPSQLALIRCFKASEIMIGKSQYEVWGAIIATHDGVSGSCTLVFQRFAHSSVTPIRRRIERRIGVSNTVKRGG